MARTIDAIGRTNMIRTVLRMYMTAAISPTADGYLPPPYMGGRREHHRTYGNLL
jgi:hypothetical protein